MLHVLVDMDGVLANFEASFLNHWRLKYPNKPFIPLEERTTFSVDDQYPNEVKTLVGEIYHAQSFFASLEPIPGAIAALQGMTEHGLDVLICSSPLSNYRNCVIEKYEWIEKHLGKSWIRRFTLTRDKTILRADILIDDRPNIQGIYEPCWEHIIYDQPYNRSETSKRRLNWQNWRNVLMR